MIDFDYEIKKINPINIEVMEFNKYKIPMDICKAIMQYNKSIANIESNNVDIAIANLKKSISYNPDFGEAIKLLGLCYIKMNEFSNAKRMFKKLMKYDMYSSLANDYLAQLKAEKSTSKALRVIKNKKSSLDNKRNIHRVLPRLKKALISTLAGCMIILCVFFLYIMRYNLYNAYNRAAVSIKAKNANMQLAAVNTSEVNKVESKATDEKYAELDQDNKKLEENLKSAKTELDEYKNKYTVITKLENAQKLYDSGNNEEAVDNLISIKNLPMESDYKERFDRLWSYGKTNAVWDIYKKSDTLYKAHKYKEALPELLKFQEFAPDPKLIPWTLYQIGMCYKETNDKANALVFFEKVKNEYKDTQYAAYSEDMIKEIKGIK